MPIKPTWNQEKSLKFLGRAGFYIEIFFPEFENDFKTGFSGAEV
jgi:hypothetical protein